MHYQMGKIEFENNLSPMEEKLLSVLKRYIREDLGDEALSTRDFILKVYERYHKYLKEEIVDVGE